MQQNNRREMSADNKRESLKTWLSITEDAIDTAMERLEEYKQGYHFPASANRDNIVVIHYEDSAPYSIHVIPKDMEGEELEEES